MGRVLHLPVRELRPACLQSCAHWEKRRRHPDYRRSNGWSKQLLKSARQPRRGKPELLFPVRSETREFSCKIAEAAITYGAGQCQTRRPEHCRSRAGKLSTTKDLCRTPIPSVYCVIARYSGETPRRGERGAFIYAHGGFAPDYGARSQPQPSRLLSGS